MSTKRLTKKICLLGDPAVGKTSLIQRFVSDIFGDEYLSTVGAKVVTRKCVVRLPESDDPVEVKLLIWDIAGQRAVTMVHQAYYNGAEAAILVADITRRSTYNNLTSWIEELHKSVGDIPIILGFNKVDLDDKFEMTPEEIGKKASEIGASYFFTSAKDGTNVEMIFDTICTLIAQRSLL